MKKPEPQIGQIIRYDYLWRDEHDRGRFEGVKERPCAVVLATLKAKDGTQHVYVAPITHSMPTADQVAIAMPSQTRKLTGLDEEKSWLVVSEVNRVAWSDPGITPVTSEQWLYGHLPRGLAKQARDKIVSLSRQKLFHSVNRDKTNIERDGEIERSK